MYTINDKEIIARYKSSKSMRAVAAYYDISTQTVRRVLISYGILPEGRTTEIANLTRSGLSKDEIAARLKIHPKTVLSHCPYTKISYRTGKKTQNALNIQRYRMRKKAKCISSQQVIQEGANIMFNPDFHPPKYIHYSYGESVALDVSRYISKHININDWPNRDAPKEHLQDILMVEQSVTGTGGGYPADPNMIRLWVLSNLGLLAESIFDIHSSSELNSVGEEFEYEQYNALDYRIRCYCLGEAISDELDKIYATETATNGNNNE